MTDDTGSEATTDRDAGERRFAPNPDVVTQRLDDELVVVHLRTNRIFLLNHTAARYWELLDSDLNSGEIEATLMREFDVEASALRKEINDFRQTLASEELINGNHDS
jgi:Coenzyme PQQ synthesis protein D (PqqD)